MREKNQNTLQLRKFFQITKNNKNQINFLPNPNLNSKHHIAELKSSKLWAFQWTIKKKFSSITYLERKKMICWWCGIIRRIDGSLTAHWRPWFGRQSSESTIVTTTLNAIEWCVYWKYLTPWIFLCNFWGVFINSWPRTFFTRETSHESIIISNLSLTRLLWVRKG